VLQRIERNRERIMRLLDDRDEDGARHNMPGLKSRFRVANQLLASVGLKSDGNDESRRQHRLEETARNVLFFSCQNPMKRNNAIRGVDRVH
jgi:hypothetical protein